MFCGGCRPETRSLEAWQWEARRTVASVGLWARQEAPQLRLSSEHCAGTQICADAQAAHTPSPPASLPVSGADQAATS